MNNQTNYFIELSRFAKQAVMSPAALTPPPPSPQYQAAAAGVGDLPYYALAGLGGGAAAAGAREIWNLLTRSTKPLHARYPGAVVADVPVPARHVDKEAAENPIIKALSGMSFGDVYDKASFPWYAPAGLAATGLGAIAGWKGISGIGDTQRKSEQEREQEEAKAEFEKALLASNSNKLAADATAGTQLGAVLDAIWEKLAEHQPDADPVKSALAAVDLFDPQKWRNALNSGVGKYLAYWGLPSAGLAAYGAYNYAEKGSRRAVLEKAMDRRLRASYQSQPSAIYATPKLVDSTDDDQQQA